ncbi:hypothetical protein AS189_15045 [Arthrobacter alpinus]|uniref:HTH marR-type domain-containing protein n=1 Tax=Arthrobacter alpinus TaxID=656366 RepID=A0A0S2M1T9_9MICC|nr:MarR family transcriptional regulator [Arthrobacter alpinus]ALO67564.1 hypothetical protein AS189_15045 [Arthrobacter alpinus]
MTSPAAHGTSTSSTTAAGIELLECHLSLLWRRARAINYQLTSNVHPDLEPAAYGLLNILMHQGGMRLTDLARRVGVGKPTVSRQIAVLLSLGLVAKEEHPKDGRAQVIDLTPAGLAKLNSINSGRQRAFHERLAGWDETELADLARLLAKLNTDLGR